MVWPFKKGKQKYKCPDCGKKWKGGERIGSVITKKCMKCRGETHDPDYWRCQDCWKRNNGGKKCKRCGKPRW